MSVLEIYIVLSLVTIFTKTFKTSTMLMFTLLDHSATSPDELNDLFPIIL